MKNIDLGKTALFIDGANIYASLKTLHTQMDYRKLLECFDRQANILRAFYYSALLPNPNNEFDGLRPLLDYLAYNGYHVVTKMAKKYRNLDGLEHIKGNMDIELAVDMMELAPFIETAVLFSGDGDFRYLLEAVQKRGVRVVVVSTIQTRPVMIADVLRRQADLFIDLMDLSEAMKIDTV